MRVRIIQTNIKRGNSLKNNWAEQVEHIVWYLKNVKVQNVCIAARRGLRDLINATRKNWASAVKWERSVGYYKRTDGRIEDGAGGILIS